MDLNIAIGEFQFSTDTAVYDSLQRSTSQEWSSHKRLGQRQAYQYLGPSDDTLSIPGAIYPCAGVGNTEALMTLREMSDAGEPYYLVDITGWVHGRWIILSIQEERGADSYIPFTLSLSRYD